MGARSKGCLTCISRRVRCDLTRPQCARCTQGRRNCQGYKQELIFINENLKIKQALRKNGAQEEGFSLAVASASPLYHGVAIHPNSQHNPPLCTELPLTAFSDEIMVKFFITNIFPERASQDSSIIHMTYFPNNGWIRTTAKQSPESLQALMAIFFAKAHHLPEMHHKAVMLYTRSIGKLRMELARSQSSFSVLASATTLCMYELISFRTGVAWMTHVDGLSRLIQLRGPKQYKRFPERSMYFEHRSILVSKAILSREKTFLAQAEWKTIPWEDDTATKAPQDYLMDTLCDTADLLSDMKHCNVDNQSEFLKLVERTKLLIEDSNEHWRSRICEYVQHIREVHVETSLIRDKEGPLFGSSLVYDNIWTTHAYCLFNTTRIILLTVWKALCKASNEQFDGPTLDVPNESHVLGITSDIVGLAKEVIRSLDYCHHPSRQFMGTFRVVLPHDVAYACLDPCSREAIFLEHQCPQLFKRILKDVFTNITTKETRNRTKVTEHT